ncbi:MAG: type II toxin-antitoxin system HicA family toxin [Oscillospiraceae bacterium]|nr:type II toxin-antitoxin system HicA family toxin [Oscillospiraceae bacterium]
MTYNELKKILKKNGFRLVREGANHEMWFSPKTNKQFTVGGHKTQEVPTGTLKSIMKSAGIE